MKTKTNPMNETNPMSSLKKGKSVQMFVDTSYNTEEIIRKRAYSIYLNRGTNPGSEHDDWHKAEKEIRHNRK